MRSIGVFGAGAIGSFVGGYLTKSGFPVTLIDQWPDHIDALKRDGLRITGSRGELQGRITPRVREIARMLSNVSVAETTTNIWGERWSKLVTNCMSNPLAGMAGAEGGNPFQTEDGTRLTTLVASEAIRVGEALG